MSNDCICKTCFHNDIGKIGICKALGDDYACTGKCDSCYGVKECNTYNKIETKESKLHLMTVSVEDWEQLRNERDELKTWAELGKLAMKIEGVCDASEFNDTCDPNYCEKIKFCQKRKELDK